MEYFYINICPFVLNFCKINCLFSPAKKNLKITFLIWKSKESQELDWFVLIKSWID